MCDYFEDEYLVDHIINTKLPSPLFKKYISYRPWLTQLTTRGCNGKNMLILDTLNTGDIFRIQIFTEDFVESENTVERNPDGSVLKVNGSKTYGASFIADSIPLKKLRIINIYKNGEPFNVPTFVYDQFLKPKVCTFILPQKIAEAYVDGDKLYIYLFGGTAGDAYLTKLIFDQKQYIGSIVSEYNDISCYRNFDGDPVWY